MGALRGAGAGGRALAILFGAAAALVGATSSFGGAVSTIAGASFVSPASATFGASPALPFAPFVAGTVAWATLALGSVGALGSAMKRSSRTAPPITVTVMVAIATPKWFTGLSRQFVRSG